MLNRIILIGRLTKDPELKIIEGSGKNVTNFIIAVNKYNKDGENKADFIPCVAWEKKAENMAKFLSKGSQIAIEGKIQTRTYDDKEGNKKFVVEVLCDSVVFLDKKPDQENVQQQDTLKSSTPEQILKLNRKIEDATTIFKPVKEEVEVVTPTSSDDDLPW